MSGPRHLLTVWNPSYADDAMDQHLRVLLHWARRWRRGEAEREDVFVWWAKLRSENRQGPLPHADEVVAIQEQILAGTETHLYLTDYRSLSVGLLSEVTADDVLAEYPDEAHNMPDYYEKRPVDFWFRLEDIRRLVHQDTPAVIAELTRLRNVRYHDRPVSLYGGIVDLPLIVTRDDEQAWFGGLDALTEGRLWAERDAELSRETERLARELRENTLGAATWDALEPASRTFLCAAEAVFRTHRDDPGFDFSGPAVEYAKAVETELNALLFPTLRRALGGKPPTERTVSREGMRLDFGGRVDHQSLGTLRLLLEKEPVVAAGLRSALPQDATWLTGQLPVALGPIIDLRNPAAHAESVEFGRLSHARDRILGVGCEGLLVEIVGVKRRAGR